MSENVIYDALTRGLVLITAICIFFFLLHETFDVA